MAKSLAGETITHRVDAGELALCQRLADEVGAIMSGVEVGMGSESGDTFHPFYVTANLGENVPDHIDEQLIRWKFGNTVFPPATITVEPLAESGTWWSEVQYDASEDDEEEQEEYFGPWREMMNWFKTQPHFKDTAFIRIGDSDELSKLDESQYPPGTEITPCALPRLATGLINQGSLVGLFGISVQT